MTLEKHGPGGTSDLGRPLTASADQVDRVVRLAPTWTLFALVASGVLVVGIVVWALTGTVSSTVTSPGILHDIGATTVRATASGQVDRVPVTVGDMVKTGQVVTVLRDGTTLTAPLEGQVVSVTVSPGSTVVPGQSVVIVADLTIDPLVVTKVAPSYISTIRVGLPVRMEVEGAPASRYGYLVGAISDITNNPYSNAQIAARLGIDQQVVASELGDAPGLLAVVRLQPDRSTPTGFAWTVGQGPSLIAQQGVMITVHTVLKESSPLGMVFPQFAPR
ncbi:MAG: HlyD family efflux transporter periplasmic adaptor subunit [Actinomycetota bacterium]|nr:HlyD family efflux transporter periplasmic adaptor subunit [Actinomycetota bacterium]